ncbi:MAG: dephospho-CoA kinase [Leptospiraceae bacterium]|nr:dephospho-CoA kinase [Leptospiraceae bacterium]MDW7975859.1 dephospho-CoA kinase [Leptospiraceae bacterium]
MIKEEIFNQYDKIPEKIYWKKKYFFIGLTGTIASGKTTVAELFRKKGFKVWNADLIAKKMYKKTKIKKKIIDKFGKESYYDNGEVNTAFLAKSIFSDRKYVDWINSIIHPEVSRYTNIFLKCLKEGEVLVYDVPLLFESDLQKSYDFDLILVIDAPTSQRMDRAQQRGWSKDEILNRERFQISPEVKRKLGDCVIWNDSTLEKLNKKVDFLSKKIITSKLKMEANS